MPSAPTTPCTLYLYALMHVDALLVQLWIYLAQNGSQAAEMLLLNVKTEI